LKTRILLGAASLLLVLYLLPPAQTATPVEKYHLAMGTVVRLAIYAPEDDASRFFDLAVAELDRIDSLMSRHSPTSEVTYVNRQAAESAVAVSADMTRVLARSLWFARLTNGAFDPTLGALTALWGFPDARVPPGDSQIDSALALTGHQQLELTENRVRFLRRGMGLDLGAAAKGYAVDRTVRLLQAAGVEAGLVEAGGDIRFWGAKPDGRNWRFGVQHPRQKDDLVVVDGVNIQALATSGDYERVFEYDGRQYHHLLDPITGHPARRAVSATVWAETAMEADILATAAFVMGPGAAVELIESMPETETLIFYMEADRLEQRVSSGLRGHIKTVQRSQE
jgi:thiamine biosynthesis lipoprotein